MRDTRIIFVGNYKGGVGKTTSVLNFAECFSRERKKILVLDLDPQSSLSEILVSNNGEQLVRLEEEKTLNYVFDLNILKIKKYNNITLQFDNIVQGYKKGGYDFVASSLFYKDGLGLDELAIRMEDNIEYLSILKNFLDNVLDNNIYDYIIIDCPPSNNLITRSAFLLADYYIIPTILDGISANGVAHYIKTVRKTYEEYCKNSEDSSIVRHFFGSEPKLLGVFCTFIRGQVSYLGEMNKMQKTISDVCGEDVHFFKEEINNYIDIARSSAYGMVSKVRNDYVRLSKSVLDILE